jgi:hypothetical protein
MAQLLVLHLQLNHLRTQISQQALGCLRCGGLDQIRGISASCWIDHTVCLGFLRIARLKTGVRDIFGFCRNITVHIVFGTEIS